MLILPQGVYAQPVPTGTSGNVANLPAPGTMVTTSLSFVPPMIKGLIIHPENPFQFDFVVDSGHAELNEDELRAVSNKLIRYFLASLTIPEKELWVNLSPYEKDRIIPDAFGKTEMGRDLLAQDYMLKQLTASLMHPEEVLGKNFWDKVYKQAYKKFGTTEIPIDTFNKVWIVPETAHIYVNKDRVFVVDSHLKVMLEEDYMALDASTTLNKPEEITVLGQELNASIIREVIIPEIEREVNEGRNFIKLRQIYHSFILASWYKKNLKQSIINQQYSNQHKVEGLEIADKNEKTKIYQQYIEAFQKGVYDLIKEDYDEETQAIVPRKYFSGGITINDASRLVKETFQPEGEVYIIASTLQDSAMSATSQENTMASSSADLQGLVSQLLEDVEGRIYYNHRQSPQIVTPNMRMFLGDYLEQKINEGQSVFRKVEISDEWRYVRTGTLGTMVIIKDKSDNILDEFPIEVFQNHMPLSRFMGMFNRLYYSVNGSKITDSVELATAVSHDSNTAKANAIEFYDYMTDLENKGVLPDTLIIQSWGVGNVAFDRDFIRAFGEIDRKENTERIKLIKYVLVDFSKTVLNRAEQALAELKGTISLEFIQTDLSRPADIYTGQTHYIRFNELYDDLPVERIVHENGKYYVFFVEPNFNLPEQINLKDGTTMSRSDFILRYFYEESVEGAHLLPESLFRSIGTNTWIKREINIDDYPNGAIIREFFVNKGLKEAVINTKALENLQRAVSLFDSQVGGIIQFYDYGTNKEGEASFRLNTDWGQPTSDVDFLFLKDAIEKNERTESVVLEKQSEYLSRVLGERVLPRRFVVSTSRDILSEGASYIDYKFIPGLAYAIKKRHLDEQKLKEAIAMGLKSLWQHAIQSGKPWVLESQIRELKSVQLLTKEGQSILMENLSNPDMRRGAYSSTKDVFHHLRVAVGVPIMPKVSNEISDNLGGIDFNPEHLDIQSQGNKVDISFPSSVSGFGNIEINGLSPFIFNITPVTNLPLLFGEVPVKEEKQLLSSSSY